MDTIEFLTGVFGHNFFEQFFDTQGFAQVDFLVSHFAACAAAGLVDHHCAMRQQKAFAFGTATQQKGRCARLHSYADGMHLVCDVLHCVVDGKGVVHTAARTVYVEIYGFFSVFGLQEQELRDDDVGAGLVDIGAEEDDPVFQQPAVDIIGTLIPAFAFDYSWN